MGTIKGTVSDEEEQRFREAAMEKFGHRRGSISKALQDAIDSWLEKNSDERRFENPVEVLSEIDLDVEGGKTGVELEDEAHERRAREAFD